ncbi:membrane dipeptidase [Nakamurella panacisegetis]|uniref:Membrane dipeptidase n=1 Tax=Nakamurella panacisegetis TaxID=1090615 RepID=A0A1H0NMF4_9ACTN|nr:dipeptidase [Nakamurella panacisegetis]SDO93766.1 membrane dipeptidase [Nakamurella panacisegetis]
MTSPSRDRVAAILAAHPVLDGHNDIAWALRKQVAYDLDARDLATSQPLLHTDIPRLRAGGVGAQFFSVYVPGTLSGGAAVTATLEQIDAVAAIIGRYPETFAAARTAADVRAVMQSGRIAALMGAEGGHSIDGSLAVLRTLHRLGVGYLTLTHNENPRRDGVAWADAATDRPEAGGLSDFGREVVREMNRLGMLVDLSHVAPVTMHAALDVSSAPVIFSHSSCRAVTDHVRNAPDDVLSRLAAGGGVVMVTFVPDFVSQRVADRAAAHDRRREELGLAKVTVYTQDAATPPEPAAAAELARWEAANPAPTASLSDVADHLDHAREIAGIDHVGLGGDYDGVESLPTGLQDVSKYPDLLVELADRGWSDADLTALTSGNILRVLQAAQDVAEG